MNSSQITINFLILTTKSRSHGYISKSTKLWALRNFDPTRLEPNSNTYQITIAHDRVRDLEIILKSYNVEYYKSGSPT